MLNADMVKPIIKITVRRGAVLGAKRLNFLTISSDQFKDAFFQ
jgi:hypothetical protein